MVKAAKVVGVCISEKKGEQKKEISMGELVSGFGLKGDAHGGDWHRQVSLLAIESVAKMKTGAFKIGNGDFAENIITEGIEVAALPVGSKLRVGSSAILEITQIGKECHHDCQIRQKAGTCIMPTEGVFARVLVSGMVTKGDRIEVISEYGADKNFRIGVLTVSDSSYNKGREDESGVFLKEKLGELGQVVQYAVVPDEKKQIASMIKKWSDRENLDLILTTGGTGLSSRDVTPEATVDVIEKDVPGIPEAMRMESMKKTDRAMLSRSKAGVRGETLIINMPGSPVACKECLEIIYSPLQHGLSILTGRATNCAREDKKDESK